MNPEELSFVTLQLAGMLKSGMPLEGALKQLCASMRAGRLRGELQSLEQDLAQGCPLGAALEKRQLPGLLVSLLRVGQASNDLPAVLSLLADYYRRAGDLVTRMNGLLIYPLIVLIACFLLSVLMAVVFTPILTGTESVLAPVSASSGTFWGLLLLQLWLPLVLISLLLGGCLLAWRSPGLRQWARWRVPGFREASFSRFASSMSLMLSRGCPISEAVGLLQQLEPNGAARAELTRWQTLMAGGVVRFTDLARDGFFIPPLFVWIVEGSGEDWTAGFGRAAEIYHGRALYRFDLMLYAALPVSICILGLLLVVQLTPLYFALGRNLSGLAGEAWMGF